MDIRYPIGQFTWTGPNTPEQRAAAIDDVDQYISLYAWHGKHHVAHITSLREGNGW
jgi:hypothetical protein